MPLTWTEFWPIIDGQKITNEGINELKNNIDIVAESITTPIEAVIVGSKQYTAKLNAATGAVIWRRDTYSPNVLVNNVDTGFLERYAVDNNGNVIVASGHYIAKLNAATGEPIWRVHTFTPAVLYHDLLYGTIKIFKIDKDDNIILSSGMYTAKLNGSTGAVIWRVDTYSPAVLYHNLDNLLSALYVMPGEIQSIEVIPW